jgi:hypothetical protein
MCMIDDGEPWEFCEISMRKARKAHRCDECAREIAPGERYENVAGKADGDFNTWRTCAHCIAARSWLTVECNGYLLGGVLDDLAEHWMQTSEYHSAWLGRAIVGMRRHWTRRDGKLMPVPALYVEREAA